MLGSVLPIYKATDLGFVCFVVINPCVLANRVDFGLFCIINFQFYSPPPQQDMKNVKDVELTGDQMRLRAKTEGFFLPLLSKL